MNTLHQSPNAILWSYRHHTVSAEAWGPDSVRVRAGINAEFQDQNSALLNPEPVAAHIQENSDRLTLINGKMRVELHQAGRLRFYNQETGELLLDEHPTLPEGPASFLPGRQFRHLQGENYRIRQEFLPQDGEHFYGLGQHPNGRLDLKGCCFDLFHHNTEFTIPYLVSSRKYGLLWNHPGLGTVELAENRTLWTAESAKQIDYWVTTGRQYTDLLRNYARATGFSPMMPDWAAGFWQCKLRYQTQEEVLEVAREYKKRSLPLDVIVIDFFHWPNMGDWKFDPQYWPDPQRMVSELKALGVEVMVSVWPTVDASSENFTEMQERGLLIRNESGFDEMQRFMLRNIEDEHAVQGAGKIRNYMAFHDATHPEARQFVWEKLKENYLRYGIRAFWLDCNEPELKHFHYHNLRYHAGNGEEVSGLYPNGTAKMIQEGMRAAGEAEFISLSRSGWAGIQRYGAVLWSGDIRPTWESLRIQVCAGLNVSMSGVPWWNTDIGGFTPPKGGIQNPEFHELLIRWFQYGTFCPVMRLHGMRNPNEVWSFGQKVESILTDYLHLRERLKPYILDQMRLAHEEGIPPMRPLFVDFENDAECSALQDQYMFGSDLLVAPVLEAGSVSRRVYLPENQTWINAWTGEEFSGGQWLEADAPVERLPIFTKRPDLCALFRR